MTFEIILAFKNYFGSGQVVNYVPENKNVPAYGKCYSNVCKAYALI